MTGDVPYYGGRFTPAQAYAAAHPHRPQAPAPTDAAAGSLQSLAQLRADGIITEAEYAAMRARIPS